MFKKATKQQSKLRMAIIGPSGAGKTMTALTIATALADGGTVAVIDTEHGSASKYADRFEFIVADELLDHGPMAITQAIGEAERAGAAVLIIDSLSHAWMGKGGALELVDRAVSRSKSGNSFQAWGEVTPQQQRMVDAILTARMHIIATMRSKTEWVLEEDQRGKKVPRKVGTAPVQRDGIEYEFDIVCEMDSDHTLVVTKTRAQQLDGAVVQRPDSKLAERIAAWLNEGEAPLTFEQWMERLRDADSSEELAALAQEAKRLPARETEIARFEFSKRRHVVEQIEEVRSLIASDEHGQEVIDILGTEGIPYNEDRDLWRCTPAQLQSAVEACRDYMRRTH